MTNPIRGYDSAFPVAKPPPWDFACPYIGGNTPHVWDDSEIAKQPARFLLPIFVHTGQDTEAAGAHDGAEIVAWMDSHKAPHGCSVAIDTEDVEYEPYLKAVDVEIVKAKYRLINYGSLDFVTKNPLTSGGRWSAHWTDIPKIDPGHNIVITQWADALMLHTDYDGDLALSAVELWDRHPAPPKPVVPWELTALDYAREISVANSKLSALLRSKVPGS